MAALFAPPPLSSVQNAALFLDFDGTLVELAETPDAIRVAPALPSLLQRLNSGLHGRLAVVSGRSLADLERHVPGGLACSGSHGLEVRLGNGSRLPLSAPADLADIHSKLRDFAATREGVFLEEKPAGAALHYRRVPQAEGEARALVEGLAAERGLSVQHGNMVAELKASDATKGNALRAFMAEPDFADAIPLFVGDDLTDEHGFAAAAELGGAGILVGPERETAARYRLPSVAAVAEWLEQAA